jgi:sugar/nucleoside kinase (ribokinase family)
VFDIVSVGHFSIDSIFLPGRKGPFTVLGGSTAYVAFAARRLDAKIAVVSKVGADFPDAYKWLLEQEGIDLSGLVKAENAQTTRYDLIYNDDLSDRTLKLKARGDPILVEELSDSIKAKVIHVAPIDGEVSYSVVEKLRSCAPILSFDPQGLVRNYDEDGNVTVGGLSDKRVLGLVDIFKSSLKEAEAVTATSDLDSAVKALHDLGVKIVIVTLGKDGAAVSVESTLHIVPAYAVNKVVDPTGAGDAFIGGFLAEYVRGEDCSWSSYVGSAVASFVVEGIGPLNFGSREEIFDRARGLYEKEN